MGNLRSKYTDEEWDEMLLEIERDEKKFGLEDMRKAWKDGWQQKINERYDESDRTFEQFIDKFYNTTNNNKV